MKTGSVFKNIIEIAGDRLKRLSRRFSRRVNAVKYKQSARNIPVKSYGISSGRNKRVSHSAGIAKMRAFIIAAASLAAAAACIGVIVSFTGNKAQAIADAGSGFPPAEARHFAGTLVMPVYASLSISEGITADVVVDIQKRLMELGYMDEDVPDGIYSDQTIQAIKHFQRQTNMDVSGTIDQQTYDLLISPEAPEYTISVGAKDSENDADVSSLQQRLYELGYISGEGVTGNYNEDTKAAVEKFQKLNNLEVNGDADRSMRELLYSDDVVANYYSNGEESDEILKYQQQLKKLGYLMSEPDGKYGPNTKAAVKRFQQSSGLIADGFLGPKTEEALMSADAEINALALGAKGDDVIAIQKRLKELKYLSSSAAADGNFGPATDNAIRSFQYNNGLVADGKVGPNTRNKLMSTSAKKSTGVNITGKNVSSLIAVAKSKRGCRYVRGGKGSNTFDCSGFVYWCLNQVNVKQGYLTSAGWAKCTKYTKITSMGSLKRGDIIVYDGHVTICEGSGYQIEASNGQGKVVERKYTGSSYWKSVFICGFRIF
jgi:peptidoglycan hydrolase-like protein with peptidoglycan-binding domain